MPALTGLALLLLCQSAGELLARGLHLPLPGPVLGLLLLWALLALPAVRAPVAAVAEPLLAHLSLLFVPVGVGVVAHLGLVAQYGGRIALALVASTVVGMVVTALVLKALLGKDDDAQAVNPVGKTADETAARTADHTAADRAARGAPGTAHG